MYPNENPCHCDCNHHDVDLHTNAFIDIAGMPFLLAEYLDRRNFQSIDRSQVYSKIDIDDHESMRAVVHISIDDIGRNGDNTLSITGNNTKQRQLIDHIIKNYQRLDHQLPVLKQGITICINYQLENNRTGQVIRAAQEKMFINDRMYYLDVNSANINDNAIITNFSANMVSSLTEFTHGRDPMLFRITSIQLSYTMIPNVPTPPVPESMISCPPRVLPNQPCGNMYDYLSRMQNNHYIGDYGCEPPEAICPPHWNMFNRLYHFENMGKDITIHFDEINNKRNRIIEIPCGKIMVNRTFYINPGHRIIWDFNIWKNDLVSVNDTTSVAAALKAPCYDPPVPPVAPPPPDYNMIMNMYNQSVKFDYEQNAVINQLASAVKDLTKTVEELKNTTPSKDTSDDSESVPSTPITPAIPSGDSVPSIPLIPATPTLPEKPGCNCHPCPPPPPPFPPCPDPVHGAIFHKINEMENQIDRVADEMVDETELTALHDDDISQIVQDAINSVPDQTT